MKEQYRILKKGELIQENDEVKIDSPEWKKTNCVGEIVPDPELTNRVYRRKIQKDEDI